MTFRVDPQTIERIAFSSTVLSGISLCFCLFLLLASLWVYSVPSARHTIDRISFRMMLWSMVFGIGYDICYILLEPRTKAINPSSNGCKVVMYWQIVTMGGVNYFITCIAVNLMLSITFAFNSMHLRLERWYVGISLFISLFVPVIPAILGHFGADPVYGSCYFTDTTLQARMRNFVLDLYLWQGSSTLIACIAVVATLVTLFRSGRATAKALLFKRASQSDNTPTNTTDSTESCHCHLKRLFRRKREMRSFQLQDRFLNIAFRIALYPLVMVIMNTVLTVGDLYLSANGDITTRAQFGLLVVYYVFYGSRNLVLAVIGIFVDPGLPRGLKLAWRASTSKSPAVLNQSSDDDSEADLDFASALASVPYNDVNPSLTTPSPTRRFFSFRQPPPAARVPDIPDWLNCTNRKCLIPDYTRSFNGVTADSLPDGMTDHVDVDPRRTDRQTPEPRGTNDGQEQKAQGDLEKGLKRERRQSRWTDGTERERLRRESEQEELRLKELLHRL